MDNISEDCGSKRSLDAGKAGVDLNLPMAMAYARSTKPLRDGSYKLSVRFLEEWC